MSGPPEDLYVVVIEELLQGVLAREGIECWWETDLDGLAGDTPAQALRTGRHRELLAIVQSYRDR